MAYERFLDREHQPDPDLIQKAIGREVLPVWEDVNAYLAKHHPDYEKEMIYYSSQHGWGIRYRKGAKQLCVLFPERASFTALLILNPEEDQIILEKINYFNARIRELLNQPSALPEGRWLWMHIEDHTDFVGFKYLLEIKER